MKLKPKSRTHVEDPVWCDQCQVRIAPYEQAVSRGTRTLHERCAKRNDPEPPSSDRFEETGLKLATV
jgi:hypothetical protein